MQNFSNASQGSKPWKYGGFFSSAQLFLHKKRMYTYIFRKLVVFSLWISKQVNIVLAKLKSLVEWQSVAIVSLELWPSEILKAAKGLYYVGTTTRVAQWGEVIGSASLWKRGQPKRLHTMRKEGQPTISAHTTTTTTTKHWGRQRRAWLVRGTMAQQCCKLTPRLAKWIVSKEDHQLQGPPRRPPFSAPSWRCTTYYSYLWLFLERSCFGGSCKFARPEHPFTHFLLYARF